MGLGASGGGAIGAPPVEGGAVGVPPGAEAPGPAGRAPVGVSGREAPAPGATPAAPPPAMSPVHERAASAATAIAAALGPDPVKLRGRIVASLGYTP
jgi:hypothetical protein